MIYYLSCTGNTRMTAERLAALLGEQTADISAMGEKSVTLHLREGERLGFCFPVHGWRPPKKFREFIRRLQTDGSNKPRYIFAMMTCGDTVGETADYLRRDLQENGLWLDAAFDVRMPNTYVGLPLMDVDKPSLERLKLTQTVSRVEETARRIAEEYKGDDLLFIGRWPRINSRLLGALFARWLVTDKPFCVDADKCRRCGMCAAVCPVANIKGAKGELPQWGRNSKCMACFACYHQCPQKAISYGHATCGKGQYKEGFRLSSGRNTPYAKL